ncbi:MAG: hypothetical protein IPJ00_18025 [Saprospirales bacterium]|nr:hypothetical protein [Saprospirales bacterium]
MKNLKIYTLLVLAFAIGCYEDKDGNPPPLDLPSLSITDLNLTEGDEDFIASFEVTLTGTNTTNVVVSLASLSRSAEAEVDYKIINPETMIFARGKPRRASRSKSLGTNCWKGRRNSSSSCSTRSTRPSPRVPDWASSKMMRSIIRN